MVITREIREEIESAVNNAVSRCIKNDTFISEIANKVTKAIEKTMEQTLRKFEEAVAEIEKRHIDRISNIEDMIDKIKQEKFELEEVIDRLDQSSRQCHLRVFGLKEKPNENVAEELKHIFKANMSIDLKDDDIKLCYRVGSRETGKIRNRCVFLKLNNLDTKENVYGKKTFLKGTGIAVREDLTKNRVKLLNGAMEKVGLNNVWTVNGRIYVNKDDLIQSSSYDIVAISETWLNGNVDGPAVQINNYNFVRRDRNDGSRGGGVGIYIKNYIKYKFLIKVIVLKICG
nr:unnamed protein product [Callosobruchus analis]